MVCVPFFDTFFIINADVNLFNLCVEIPDLTHAPTVEIFRRWDQIQLAYIQLLRFIRISSENPSSVVVSRPGKHRSINIASRDKDDGGATTGSGIEEMVVD